MTLTIELPTELEQTLIQEAAKTGQDVGAFILDAVREKIAKASTIDEVCAPFSHAVSAAGISDEDFDAFFQTAREEVWQEKQGSPP